MKENIDISVIVLVYNPDVIKLESTIKSIISQKRINFEIIIADDGSDDLSYLTNISSFFEKNSVNNYIFSILDNNLGTVLNYYKAIKLSQGKYIKPISAGDYLYDDFSLKRWFDFLEVNNILISCCNAAYYKIDVLENMNFDIRPPISNYQLYSLKNTSNFYFVDYLISNDTVLGASLIVERQLLLSYIKMIKNKVIYAEDFSVRLMIYSGVRLVYYPECLIYYEYSTGISNGNKKWRNLIHSDFEASNEIIKTLKLTDSIQQKKFNIYLKLNNSLLKKFTKAILFPSFVFFRLKMKISKYKYKV